MLVFFFAVFVYTRLFLSIRVGFLFFAVFATTLLFFFRFFLVHTCLVTASAAQDAAVFFLPFVAVIVYTGRFFYFLLCVFCTLCIF